MRTVIAITLSVAGLSLSLFSQSLVLQLPLVDHTGTPLAGRPVEVLAEGPGGREAIRAVSGPEGVLVRELHLSRVWALIVSVAGYLPAQVSDLRIVEAEDGDRTRMYLIPAAPVRLVPWLQTGLLWSPARPLSWTDFRGPPPQTPGREGARIHIVVSYQVFIEVQVAADGFRAVIPEDGVFTACGMDPSLSWVRPEAKLPKLLAHEQGHFDLAEVYRRLLQSRLRGLSALRSTPEAARAALREEAATVAQGVLARLEAAQARYDEETDHGLEEEEQQRWLGLIESWLKAPLLAP